MPRGEEYHVKQRAERTLLEQHARAEGCDLVIDPAFRLDNRGPGARSARLRTLMEFLESMPDDKVRVAVRPRMRPGNLLIVGDWFIAESLTPAPGAGFLQTVFTRHAPTVLERVKQFDDEFEDLLKETGIDAKSSRPAAVAAIKEELQNS